MNSTIGYSRFLASAMCVLALVGCDSIKDVPEEPFGDLPTPLTVVGGSVTGLSSLRSITVTNNGIRTDAQTFAAPNPTSAGEQVAPFSFGGIKQGEPYHIEVAVQPFGKRCEVSPEEGSPAQGTVGAATVNVVFRCHADADVLPLGRRLNLTVNLPSDRSLFIDLPGATVRLTTEEQIYDLDLQEILDNPTDPANVDNYELLTANPGNRRVTFTGVLVDATSQPNAFPWLVGAFTKEGGRLNKCGITGASNTVGTTTTNPTGDVITPRVGTAANQTTSPCKYTIGGRVGYSQPISTAYVAKPISGLKLELRNAQGRPVGNLGAEFLDSDPANGPKGPKQFLVDDCSAQNQPTPAVTALVTAGANSGATATTFGCSFTLPYDLRSNSEAVFDLVVAAPPQGMSCLVTKGGAALLFVANPTTAAATNTNPGNVTDTNVICREIPTDPAKRLSGVYRLKSQTWNTQATTTSTPVTIAWRPFNRSVQNHATSAMLAFFDDGTFLYGTHNNDAGTQVEHGFYDYDPTANTGFTFRVGGQTVTLTADYSADTDAANVRAAIAAQLASPLPGVTVGYSGTRVTFTANTTGPEFNSLVVVNGNGNKITVDPDSDLTHIGSAGVAAVTTTGPMNLAFNNGGRLSFSPIVDTNPSQTFPTSFSNSNNWGVDGSFGFAPSVSGTPGISASPGSPRLRYLPVNVTTATTAAQTTYVTEPTMREVVVGSAGLRLDEIDDNGNVVIPEGVPPLNAIVRTLTGRWGAAGTAVTTNGATAPAVPATLVPATAGVTRLDWILEEPPQVAQEMTGTWVSQDHRRLWSWDFRTYYGFAVGVLGGGTSLNDACFTMDDIRAHKGLYTRRGTITGCYPFNRPSNLTIPGDNSGTTYAVGTKESRQMVVLPPGTGALSDFTTSNAGLLPGFVGFIPGGLSSLDGRSPSPTYFHIAPADSFFKPDGSAAENLFPKNFPVATSPVTDLSWCTTEVLGIRSTSHGLPINYPVYFCRAN